MTTHDAIPMPSGETATGTDIASTSGDATAEATMLPQLWAQTHALRCIADLLDRLDQPGLALTVDDRINVQVPAHLGPEQQRTAAVARLAAALGTHALRKPGLTAARSWLVADGHLAGHPVHVYTPLDHADPIDDADDDHADDADADDDNHADADDDKGAATP